MSEKAFTYSLFAGVLAFVLVMGGLVYSDIKRAERERPAQERRYAEQEALDKLAFESCLKRGGVPIRSHWDGRLKDCK